MWVTILLWLQATAGNSPSVLDDECGHEACTLQMLQHVAERKDRQRSPMNPDPAVLRWDQPPSAGSLVSGTLSVFLDPADEKSPKLDLEVAMFFDKQQPAPLGALLLHCGGPGSSSTCVNYVPGSILQLTVRQVFLRVSPACLAFRLSRLGDPTLRDTMSGPSPNVASDRPPTRR